MEELISVIVPIYKVEKYLDKCINSIVNQTYKNLEIILVDDGSPDNCPKLCDDWGKKDERIKVIHKTNGGLSSARNAGLDVFKGEYICFVDSDDWLEDKYVEELYKTLTRNNADLSLCGINKITENGEIFQNIKSIDTPYFTNADKYNFMLEKSIMVMVAWNKLYKKSIWENLRYPLGKINEDEFVLLDIINNTKQGIAVTNKKLYNYLHRKNSIMTRTSTNGIFDVLEAYEDRYNRLENDLIKDQTALLILNHYIDLYKKFYNNSIRHEIKKRFKSDYRKYKKHVHKFKDKIKYLIFKTFPFVLK